MSNTLKKTIEEAIKDGTAAMKPRWQFTVEHALGFILGIGALLLIWYLGSLTTYVIRANELAYLPGFGPTGWQRLLISLPWVLILAGGLLILATNLITRSQTMLYRQPWGATLLGVLFIALAGIAIFNQARLHDHIVKAGPPRFIRYYSPLPQRVKPIIGTVVENGENHFVMENPEGTFTVDLEGTHAALQDISTGQRVIIIGEPAGETIKAYGIRSANKKPRQAHGKPREMKNFK